MVLYRILRGYNSIRLPDSNRKAMDFRLVSLSPFLKEYFCLGFPVVLVVILDEILQRHGHGRGLGLGSSDIKSQSGFFSCLCSFCTKRGDLGVVLFLIGKVIKK